VVNGTFSNSSAIAQIGAVNCAVQQSSAFRVKRAQCTARTGYKVCDNARPRYRRHTFASADALKAVLANATVASWNSSVSNPYRAALNQNFLWG
jgi:hypothetical protein